MNGFTIGLKIGVKKIFGYMFGSQIRNNILSGMIQRIHLLALKSLAAVESGILYTSFINLLDAEITEDTDLNVEQTMAIPC